jgi:hypothetical protein
MSVNTRALLSFVIASFALFYAGAARAGDEWISKSAGPRWTWLEDYFYLRAHYQIACEPSRLCEVGSGMKIRGKPRGSVQRFRGVLRISVYGAGAIHIRAADGLGTIKVQFRQSDAEAVTGTLNWNPK